MNILFFGAPGCGKGTQSKFIIKEFGIPQISTGDLLREEIKGGSSLGKEIQEIMSTGKFVSDDLVLSLVSKKLDQDECKKGFILDGYPRNISQAKSLDKLFITKNIALEYVFLIDVPFETLIKRCTGRLLCTTSGYIGNTDRGEKVGDKCEGGGELYQREDDKEEIAIRRYETYEKNIDPVINFYKQTNLLKVVNGEATISEISEEIGGLINSIKGWL